MWRKTHRVGESFVLLKSNTTHMTSSINFLKSIIPHHYVKHLPSFLNRKTLKNPNFYRFSKRWLVGFDYFEHSQTTQKAFSDNLFNFSSQQKIFWNSDATVLKNFFCPTVFDIIDDYYTENHNNRSSQVLYLHHYRAY